MNAGRRFGCAAVVANGGAAARVAEAETVRCADAAAAAAGLTRVTAGSITSVTDSSEFAIEMESRFHDVARQELQHSVRSTTNVLQEETYLRQDSFACDQWWRYTIEHISVPLRVSVATV
jgi:hypothetical protein